MSTFSYQAIDRQGQTIRGKLNAENKESVIVSLKQQGIYVTKLAEEKSLRTRLAPKESSILSMEINLGPKVRGSDFAVFTRQLATLLKAGVTVTDGIAVLSMQTERKALAKALKEIAIELQSGSQFSEAAAQKPDIFPTLFVNMLRAGEASGNLDDVLEKLAHFYEKEHYTREKIKSAMTYPAIVAVGAVGVIIFLMTSVIPTFVGVFASFHAQLPMATRIIIATSHFMVQFWYVLLLLVVGMIALYVYAMKKPKYRYYRDLILLKLPVFGVLLQKSGMAKMARTLGSLFASAVPVLQALKLTSDAVQNEVISRVLREAGTSLTAGQPLSDPLSKSWVFPPLVVHMVTVGEQTGNLDYMLNKIADFYEAETDAMVDRLKTLIEPLMMVILTTVVGTIVIAVIQPMFSIYQQMNSIS